MIPLKSLLGGSWAPFWTGLGRPGAPFGRSWALLGRFGVVQDGAFSRLWSKMGFKKPFGGIWDGFGEDLERILGGFGKVLARFWERWKSFGRVWGGSGKDFHQFLEGFWQNWGQNMEEH